MSTSPLSSAASALRALLESAGPPPRVLLVAAHPDDEVASAGGLLLRLAERGAEIHLLHVTDGAPLDGQDARKAGFPSARTYARARRRELIHALATGGIPTSAFHTLAVADQSASFHLESVARGIVDVIRLTAPDVLLTHPYEGGHPDHDAAAFGAWAAVAIVGECAPAIEFSSYHLGAAGLRTGHFLPSRESGSVAVVLTDEQRHLKQLMLDCFVTQRTVLAQFPVDVEQFRPQPAYDFSRPPHAGRLLYEYFPWGTDGAGFRRRAAAACSALGLEARSCL